MNSKQITTISIVILGICCIAGFALQNRNAEASSEVELSLNISKKVFQLGEILSIETKITNNASVPIYVEGDSNYAVAIKIAFKEDNDYKLYAPPGPLISLDGVYFPTEIKPRGSFSKHRTILWNINFSSEVKNLSEHAAKSYTEGRILSDYAFPEAGIYFIKAVAVVLKDKKPVQIESVPIQITIEKPQGQDLEVWNMIKGNGEFAYFMQEGDVTRGYRKAEVRAKFQQELQDILHRYPNSFYAEPLRQSLERFRVHEARREEFNKRIPKSQSMKN